jgi:pimeloyl-ACP methyl ester carboxylesterase
MVRFRVRGTMPREAAEEQVGATAVTCLAKSASAPVRATCGLLALAPRVRLLTLDVNCAHDSTERAEGPLSVARGRENKGGVSTAIRGVPPGRKLSLAGRGETWVCEAAGPPGAPTVLLLHGLGATAALNWHAVIEPLRARYRVVALDHRGHGRGVHSLRRFRLADCADDAAALCDALAIDRVVAVGYSMGGPIAQLLWYRHRERVAGLVLCATARNFRGRPRAALPDLVLPAVIPGLAVGARLVPSAIRRRFLDGVLTRRIRNPDARAWVSAEIADHDPGAILQASRALHAFSSNEWIGSVDVPTAVVVTEKDGLVSPAAQRKLAAAIPGATVYSVDGDHGACAYRPREFAAALLEACESVVSRGRARFRASS